MTTHHMGDGLHSPCGLEPASVYRGFEGGFASDWAVVDCGICLSKQPTDGRPSVPDTMAQLYRINDVLTSLALELGVTVTEEWEDDVLNDLALTVGRAMGVSTPTDGRPSVPATDDYLQVFMTHDVVIDAFKRWLTSQGWELQAMPRFAEDKDDPDHVRTHFIVPAGFAELMRQRAAEHRAKLEDGTDG